MVKMNKLKFLLLVLTVSTLVAGCFDESKSAQVDADGVPLVDLNGRIVPREVVGESYKSTEFKRYVNVAGEEIPLGYFHQTYCLYKKIESDRCKMIGKQVRDDFLNRYKTLKERPFDK